MYMVCIIYCYYIHIFFPSGKSLCSFLCPPGASLQNNDFLFLFPVPDSWGPSSNPQAVGALTPPGSPASTCRGPEALRLVLGLAGFCLAAEAGRWVCSSKSSAGTCSHAEVLAAEPQVSACPAAPFPLHFDIQEGSAEPSQGQLHPRHFPESSTLLSLSTFSEHF